jgi:uroporphyrinogen decarboxylase
MTSRERVKRAIRFERPDRVPIIHAYLPASAENLGERFQEVLAKYPSDYASSVLGAYYGDTQIKMVGGDTDVWGCRWSNLQGGIVGQVTGHPLADWDAFTSYVPPDPAEYLAGDEAPEGTRRTEPDKYVVAFGGNLFERMQWLRGYENLMVDLALGEPRVVELRDLIVEHNVKAVEILSRCDIDAVEFSDDWGTQRQLMIRPELWRELFKPAYRTMFSAAHDKGLDAHFHTDGYTIDIIQDLSDVGVDVLNVQLSAMDVSELSKRFRGRICFRTDLDRQYVLPRGTPDEVDQHVKLVMESLGTPKGGLIGCGEIGPDVPIENVEAMFAAFRKYGAYDGA